MAKATHYYQRWIRCFIDPISPEELAGLSMEEEIDSRFVSNANEQWQAEHGPFSEDKFADLGTSTGL
ncbi:hypothetical protein JCM19239_2237 [Vibrio variabilis]|uniref:Uncharacterized protein n=1 Tax=Vibrio variabilis TaxID=990271 RepID=A0ABQ0JPF6_9VIBR|nr:hypothetical protein JCM19239_2237 [Vibrio variabilis]